MPVGTAWTGSAAIAVAPNGARKTKADHPAVPLTGGELALCAAECLEAGAAMIHVHIRRPDGGHLLDAGVYADVTRQIRSTVADRLVIQITSEAFGLYRAGEQMQVVRAVRPEAVSLALRELLPDGSDATEFAAFMMWCRTERVMPQIILYSADEARRLADLKARGIVPFDDVPVLYVLGRYSSGQTAQPADLLPFIGADAPAFRHWSVCAFGRHETACVLAAAILGGDVRVGFENNEHLPDGRRAASNADLVGATRHAMAAAGIACTDADALRRSWAEMRG